MKTAAVIRAKNIDGNVDRLLKEIRPYFKENIFVILERYSNNDIDILIKDNFEILLGGNFLRRNGFPNFKRAGWQCGDFIYYAACEALPEFDEYWLIEDDVSFKVDVKEFFSSFESKKEDILLFGFEAKKSQWIWHKTVQATEKGEVYGGIFALSRMSRNAAIVLKKERSVYSKDFVGIDGNLNIRSENLYANDEAFVATTGMRLNLKCSDIRKYIDKDVLSDFSLYGSIDPNEIVFTNNKVLHPVCKGKRARTKLRTALFAPELKSRFYDRRSSYLKKMSESSWEEYSGVPSDFLAFLDSEITERSARISAEILNKTIVNYLKIFKNFDFYFKVWIYDEFTSVVDIKFGGRSVAIDISPVFERNGNISRIVVDVIGRNHLGRNFVSDFLKKQEEKCLNYWEFSESKLMKDVHGFSSMCVGFILCKIISALEVENSDCKPDGD